MIGRGKSAVCYRWDRDKSAWSPQERRNSCQSSVGAHITIACASGVCANTACNCPILSYRQAISGSQSFHAISRQGGDSGRGQACEEMARLC
jgi:hypothetical protein